MRRTWWARGGLVLVALGLVAGLVAVRWWADRTWTRAVVREVVRAECLR